MSTESKDLDLERLAEDMRDKFPTDPKDFDFRQSEVARAVAAAIEKQAREGCGIPTSMIVFAEKRGKIQSGCAYPVTMDMVFADSRQVVGLLWRNVREVAKGLRARSVTVVMCVHEHAEYNIPAGIFLVHEGVRAPARGWLAQGEHRSERCQDGFKHIGDFLPFERKRAPPQSQLWWDLLPPECYASAGAVRGVQ